VGGLDVNRLNYPRYTVSKLQVISQLDARFGTGELMFGDIQVGQSASKASAKPRYRVS
jgi:hypothetical protein